MSICIPTNLKHNLLTENSTQKNPDDVVITLALRTPLAKAIKGGFKDTDLDYMVYALLKETLYRANIDPALIEDVCMGNVRSLPRMPIWHIHANYDVLRSAMVKPPTLSVPPPLPPESPTQPVVPP